MLATLQTQNDGTGVLDVSEFAGRYRYTQLFRKQWPGEVMQERQRLEYLQAMGIQVWRDKRSPLPHLEYDPGDSSPDDSSIVDDINVCLVKYPQCLAVIDLPAAKEGLASDYQQLLDDVVKAIGLDNSQKSLFHSSEGLLESGPDETLHNRVVQLLGGANSFLLVLGNLACQRLLGSEVETFTVIEFMGRKAVAGKGLGDMLQSPALKRSLWVCLQQQLSGR